MVVHLKIFSIAVLLLSLRLCHCEETTEAVKDDLMESESKDPTKVEIIKQIKRVNEDGSYTFGYEAEDGTFKIESRDVLGNIKGTFGFVDSDGEIKRVSYSSSNNSETATISSIDKDRSSVIQQIPKSNRTSSTTRRPSIIYPHVTPSPTSTVIQSIPRRRLPASSSSTLSTSSSNNTSSSSTSTVRPSYKNIAKSTDFDITTIQSSTTESSPTRISSTSRPGHYIRSTVSPQSDSQRFTEGQLIRPTQPDNVTPRPTETTYPRRIHISRNQYLDEAVSSTIKPIVEESYDDNVRGNLLRRQLNQEKVSNFDARQHVLSLQQSVGDDSTDVYSASLTTGTPRPLFTTTDRSRIFATPTLATIKGITPAKYQPIYPKSPVRGIRPQNYIQETTTDATNTDSNYASPTAVPVLQIPNSEDQQQIQQIPVVRSRHPFHRGAFLIPVNQLQGGRLIVEEPHEEAQQPQYITQYAQYPDQQYLRESSQIQPVPIQIIPRRRPVAVPVPVPVQFDEYNRQDLFRPTQPTQSYPIPLTLSPSDIQDEIDNIKPPVSTKDFQKLLNRLILRQSQLQEISRLENRMIQQTYVNPERYQRVVQPTPVSVFVRARPEMRQNGPLQFINQQQTHRPKSFITIPQTQQHIPMQKLMESQQQFHTADPYNDNYAVNPYRSGRRVARLLHPASHTKEDDDNYLPADVREMLLLRMLQLAINPNLPLQPSEGETMVTAIRQQHKKEAIRNVEILGEEREVEKPVSRNKRYRESDEYEYY